MISTIHDDQSNAAPSGGPIQLAPDDCREIAAWHAVFGNTWDRIAKKRSALPWYPGQTIKALMHCARRSKRCQRNPFLCLYYKAIESISCNPRAASVYSRTGAYLQMVSQLELPHWDLDHKVRLAHEAALRGRSHRKNGNASQQGGAGGGDGDDEHYGGGGGGGGGDQEEDGGCGYDSGYDAAAMPIDGTAADAGCWLGPPAAAGAAAAAGYLAAGAGGFAPAAGGCASGRDLFVAVGAGGGVAFNTAPLARMYSGAADGGFGNGGMAGGGFGNGGMEVLSACELGGEQPPAGGCYGYQLRVSYHGGAAPARQLPTPPPPPLLTEPASHYLPLDRQPSGDTFAAAALPPLPSPYGGTAGSGDMALQSQAPLREPGGSWGSGVAGRAHFSRPQPGRQAAPCTSGGRSGFANSADCGGPAYVNSGSSLIRQRNSGDYYYNGGGGGDGVGGDSVGGGGGGGGGGSDGRGGGAPGGGGYMHTSVYGGDQHVGYLDSSCSNGYDLAQDGAGAGSGGSGGPHSAAACMRCRSRPLPPAPQPPQGQQVVPHERLQLLSTDSPLPPLRHRDPCGPREPHLPPQTPVSRAGSLQPPSLQQPGTPWRPQPDTDLPLRQFQPLPLPFQSPRQQQRLHWAASDAHGRAAGPLGSGAYHDLVQTRREEQVAPAIISRQQRASCPGPEPWQAAEANLGRAHMLPPLPLIDSGLASAHCSNDWAPAAAAVTNTAAASAAAYAGAGSGALLPDYNGGGGTAMQQAWPTGGSSAPPQVRSPPPTEPEVHGGIWQPQPQPSPYAERQKHQVFGDLLQQQQQQQQPACPQQEQRARAQLAQQLGPCDSSGAFRTRNHAPSGGVQFDIRNMAFGGHMAGFDSFAAERNDHHAGGPGPSAGPGGGISRAAPLRYSSSGGGGGTGGCGYVIGGGGGGGGGGMAAAHYCGSYSVVQGAAPTAGRWSVNGMQAAQVQPLQQ